MADNHIVELVEKDDLVITADIPLAAEVIDKEGKHSTRAGSCIPRLISARG